MAQQWSRRGLLSLAGTLPLWGLEHSSTQSPRAIPSGLDVRSVGAKGDGVADDQPAFQRAIDTVAAAGGGTVLVPPGTYLFKTVQGAWRTFMRPRSGVTLVGTGAPSILKAGPHLNRDVRDEGFSFIRHTVGDEGRPRCDDFAVEGLTFDHNGGENLIARGIRSNGNMALSVAVGRRLRFERNICRNNPGAQTVSFGANQEPVTVAQVLVRGNLFEGMGGGVPGNDQNQDHSTIYLQAADAIVAENIFRNEGPPRLNTAIEIHGTDAIVIANVVEGYALFMNLVAQSCSSRRILVADNLGSRLRHAAVVWQRRGMELADVVVRGNHFERVADPDASAPAFFDADSNVESGVERLTIRDNTFRSLEAAGAARAQAGIRFGRASEIQLRGNDFAGFSGRGVEFGEMTPGGRVRVEDNEFRDCASCASPRYQQALAFNTIVELGLLQVARNLIHWTGPTPGRTGIQGNASVRRGEVSDNMVQGAEVEVVWSSLRPPVLTHRGERAPGVNTHGAPGSVWRTTSGPAAGTEYLYGPEGWHPSGSRP